TRLVARSAPHGGRAVLHRVLGVPGALALLLERVDAVAQPAVLRTWRGNVDPGRDVGATVPALHVLAHETADRRGDRLRHPCLVLHREGAPRIQAPGEPVRRRSTR